MKYLIAVLLVTGLFVYVTENRDEKRNTFADCVVKTAEAEGYPNPHSAEAWSLFADICN